MKKITKCILGCLLTMIMLWSCKTVCQAATTECVLSYSSSSAVPGGTIVVTLKAGGDNIKGIEAQLSYNDSQLELVSSKSLASSWDTKGVWDVQLNGKNFYAVDNSLSTPLGSAKSLYQLTFKIKSTVADGTAVTVSFKNLYMSDGNKEYSLGTKSVSVTVDAPKSTDATLKSLTLSKGTLSPSFSAGTTTYTATVENSVTSITVGATANHSKATVSGTGTYTLTAGATKTISIKVTAESGATKTYTVKVTRKAATVTSTPSTDATLKTLTISKGTLSPSFSAGTTTYTATVDNDVSSVTIGATANSGKATVSGTGAYTLTAGVTKTISIKVTAESGATKTYTVKVTRKAASSSSISLSSNNKLKSLTISDIDNLYFSAGRKEYDAEVAHDISSVRVNAIAQDEDAKVTIRYNGDLVSNGMVSLRVGSSNYIGIEVKAADGSTRQYNIQITRAKEADVSSGPSSTVPPVSSDAPSSSEPTSSDAPSSSDEPSSDNPSSSEPESSDVPPSSEPTSSDDPVSSDNPTSSQPDVIARPQKDLSGLVIHTAYIGGMILCLLAGCMLGYFIRNRRKD